MSEHFKKDEIYALPIDQLIDFSFDQKTVSVFPDMINRSVPGYSLMQSLSGLIASQYVTEGSRVYDLGCSLGASSMALINSIKHDDYNLILVDQSQPMIEQCQVLFEEQNQKHNISFRVEDVRDCEICSASMVMLNLVLQFIPIADRQMLIEKIFSGLRDKAVLVLSEKIHLQPSKQQLVDQLYFEFKKRSGYSELEISQKRQALENVMQVESIEQHKDRLFTAGFSKVIVLMQALNFVTLLAIK